MYWQEALVENGVDVSNLGVKMEQVLQHASVSYTHDRRRSVWRSVISVQRKDKQETQHEVPHRDCRRGVSCNPVELCLA